MKVTIRNNISIILVGLILILGMGGLFFWKVNANEDSPSTDASIKRVKAEKVGQSEWQSFDNYGGFVKGENESELAPKVNGRIISIKKEEGEKVKKGEALVFLNIDEINAQAQTVNKTIEALYKNLEQTERYYKQKVDEAKDNKASSEEIKSAKRMRDLQAQSLETEITQAKGSLGEVRVLLQESIIRAPFDGVIIGIDGEVGQLVSPTSSVIKIADDNNLVIEIFVSQDVLKNIELDQEIRAFDNKDKKDYVGKVDIKGVVSGASGQKALLRINFDKNTQDIYLGQYLDLNLPISREVSAVVIDEKSIVAKYNQKFVYKIETGVVKKTEIEIGKIKNGQVEVIKGIEAGDVIITEGLSGLRNNDKVEIYE